MDGLLLILLIIIGGMAAYTWYELYQPDHNAVQIAELRSLYYRVRDERSFDAEHLQNRFAETLSNVNHPLKHAFIAAVNRLLEAERFPGEPSFNTLSLKERADLTKTLRAWRLRSEDTIAEFLSETFGNIVGLLPEISEPSPLVVPLINILRAPREYIHLLLLQLEREEFRDAELFSKWRDQLWLNLCYVSETDPDHPKKLIYPTKSTLPLDRLVKAYLRHTPFEDLFLSPLPLKLTLDQFYSHVHLLGGSGAGKTVTIERLIMWLQGLEDPPTVVLVDPHSDLVRKLAKFPFTFDPLIIDPRDSVQHPLALNIFAPSDRMDQYDDVTKEQVTAGAIETFVNLFQNLGIPLTGKQDVLFRACIRMLLSFPEVVGRNATIKDMLDLMKGPPKGDRWSEWEPYGQAIESLPPLQREFFDHDFMSKTFDQTREQIRYRLQAIISEPTMERIFCSPETRIDFFSELNSGGLILIDCAKDFLKTEGAANLGRLMLSLIFRAIMERAALPAHERKPVILFIDEAANLFSRDISAMLEEVRKYKTGVVLSHQELSQCDSKLAASIHSNTSTKLCSGVSAADASAMAREMRCETDFILSQPRLQFATYIRHVTPAAVSVPMPFTAGMPEREDYQQLLERNRARVSLLHPPPKVKNPIGFGVELQEFEDVDKPERKFGFHTHDDDDISKDW